MNLNEKAEALLADIRSPLFACNIDARKRIEAFAKEVQEAERERCLGAMAIQWQTLKHAINNTDNELIKSVLGATAELCIDFMAAIRNQQKEG